MNSLAETPRIEYLAGMQIEELTEHEVLALVVLAKHMIHVDGVVSKDEMLDLMSLGQALGMQRFAAVLDRTENLYKDIDTVAHIASGVQRFDARVLIFVLLEELAKGDGADAAEKRFLSDLQRFWGLHE